MNSLDRFSRSLEGERVSSLSFAEIMEQRELNKQDLVFSFIDRYVDDCGRLPEAEDIQETFYKVGIDLDLIEKELNYYQSRFMREL